MQWCGPVFGFGSDEQGFVTAVPGTAAESLRCLRCAWVRALVECGEYDTPDALEGVLDVLLNS